MASTGGPCFRQFRGLRQSIDMSDLQVAVNLGQHLLQQIRIGRIVFHQQNAKICLVLMAQFLGRLPTRFNEPSRHARVWLGNFTTVSQNSSIDLTTFKNCLKSTGLVM